MASGCARWSTPFGFAQGRLPGRPLRRTKHFGSCYGPLILGGFLVFFVRDFAQGRLVDDAIGIQNAVEVIDLML